MSITEHDFRVARLTTADGIPAVAVATKDTIPGTLLRSGYNEVELDDDETAESFTRRFRVRVGTGRELHVVSGIAMAVVPDCIAPTRSLRTRLALTLAPERR